MERQGLGRKKPSCRRHHIQVRICPHRGCLGDSSSQESSPPAAMRAPKVGEGCPTWLGEAGQHQGPPAPLMEGLRVALSMGDFREAEGVGQTA